jgi:signal recognition particle GTPase
MCDDCGMDKDIEQQQEREGKQVKEQLLQETAEILTMKDFSVEEIKQILDNIYEDGRASK